MKPQPSSKIAPTPPKIVPLNWREILWALGIGLVFACLFFHKPLFSTGIAQCDNLQITPSEGISGASECIYSGYPPYYFGAEQIKKGLLPLWTPHACGGTPFIGNLQNGLLSP